MPLLHIILPIGISDELRSDVSRQLEHPSLRPGTGCPRAVSKTLGGPLRDLIRMLEREVKLPVSVLSGDTCSNMFAVFRGMYHFASF